MVVEQEVVFQSGKWELGGTLAFPEEPGSAPAVLLIPGSGQVDRNENARKLHINVFYEISHFLAENGIGSLRYDKRGVGTSQGNYWETGFYDNVADALAALGYLKSHERVCPDKVFLLGHSEGAIISTKLAGNGADVAGAVLLAGTAQRGEDVLMWQTQQVVKNMSGIQRWLIDHLRLDVIKSLQKRLDKIKHSDKDWLRVQLIAKVNAKWMREFLAYNPEDDLKKIRVPLLAITGSKDIQVDPADLKKMATLVKTDFEYHQVEGVSHILRRVDSNAGLSSYKQQILKSMDLEILQLIVKWLNAKTKRED